MKLIRSIAVLLAGLHCMGVGRPVLFGTVTRVVNGDTLVVQLSSGPIRVRLYGIDAPEHNQPGGREAAAALTSLVNGERVELEPINQDRYSRMVAHVLRGQLDVNAGLRLVEHEQRRRGGVRPSDRSVQEHAERDDQDESTAS